MSNEVEKLIDELEYNNIDVYQNYESDGCQYIIAKEMIITIENNGKNIGVAFLVGTRPEISARRVLMIQSFFKKASIVIMESYVHDKKKLLTGDEAYDYMIETQAKEALNKVLEDFAIKNYLENMPETKFSKC